MSSWTQQQTAVTQAPPTLALWGGLACTVNWVGELYQEQVDHSGHHNRPTNLDRIAGLGIQPTVGLYDWHYLLTRQENRHEPGVFDLSSGPPAYRPGRPVLSACPGISSSGPAATGTRLVAGEPSRL